jgi:hypothetical protein
MYENEKKTEKKPTVSLVRDDLRHAEHVAVKNEQLHFATINGEDVLGLAFAESHRLAQALLFLTCKTNLKL